ncbi:MAG: hypothetical protein GY793_03295 [Proteobacteria bacterium]|nr:hypothetical protein [Pseudomonadota bacterium]
MFKKLKVVKIVILIVGLVWMLGYFLTIHVVDRAFEILENRVSYFSYVTEDLSEKVNLYKSKTKKRPLKLNVVLLEGKLILYQGILMDWERATNIDGKIKIANDIYHELRFLAACEHSLQRSFPKFQAPKILALDEEARNVDDMLAIPKLLLLKIPFYYDVMVFQRYIRQYLSVFI